MKKLMFAGTASSSGKTTITCGFMKALTDRGMKVASFKCGPDYIDPMFHEQIVGTHAGNLDGFFLKNDRLSEMLLKNSAGCDIAVLEGVMGCYDGIGFTREASGYEVAVATDTPIVLIANARGMAVSLIALVRGFIEEDREGRIRGVILNQLPAKLFPEAKKAIEAIRPGLICYGYVPVNRALELKSRHLGLVTPGEVSDMKEKVSLAARQIEETLDVDGLIRLAGEAEGGSESKDGLKHPGAARDEAGGHSGTKDKNSPYFNGAKDKNGTIPGEMKDGDRTIDKTQDENGTIPGKMKEENRTIDGTKNENGTVPDGTLIEIRTASRRKTRQPELRIAVAKDRAFSFLYRDNLNWLAERGAEPVFFSPLEDENIPANCQGLILPGGYPELYLEDLERNGSMRASVRQAIADGMPTIAECGGFLYLLDRVEEHCLSERDAQDPTKRNNRLERDAQNSDDRSNPPEKAVLRPAEGDSSTEKTSYSLCGVIHQTAKNSHRLGRFGYIYLTARTDGLLAAAGETIRAHEFHHYTTEDDGHAFWADKASGTGSWETGYHTKTLYAGFPHIYFPGNEKAGERFLEACAGCEAGI